MVVSRIPVSTTPARAYAPAAPPPAVSEAVSTGPGFTTADSFETVESGSTRAPSPAGPGARGYVGADPSAYTHFNQRRVCRKNPNACGTTSLAMVLADKGAVKDDLRSAQQVDRQVRPWGGFSAPRDLQQYAAKKGVESRGLNGSTFEEMKDRLQAGNGVMAMVDGGRSPHWVRVLGVKTDPATGEQSVTIADPGRSGPGTLSRSEFEKKWARPNDSQMGGVGNDSLGYRNYLIAFDDDAKKLPSARDHDVAHADAAADGISDVASGYAHLKQGRVPTALGQTIGGTLKTATAVPGAVGRVVEVGGDRTLGWARDEWDKGGLHHKVSAGAAAVPGAILKGSGAALKAGGLVVGEIGNAVGRAVERVTNW